MSEFFPRLKRIAPVRGNLLIKVPIFSFFLQFNSTVASKKLCAVYYTCKADIMPTKKEYRSEVAGKRRERDKLQ